MKTCKDLLLQDQTVLFKPESNSKEERSWVNGFLEEIERRSAQMQTTETLVGGVWKKLLGILSFPFDEISRLTTHSYKAKRGR